jgi:hypothetical protein
MMRWGGYVPLMQDKCSTGFVWVTLKERGNLHKLDVDKRMILKWIMKKTGEGVEQFNLARNRDKWLAVVNTAMNFGVQ